jgi:hypothetical protein
MHLKWEGGMHLKCGGARGGGGWELRVRVSVMDALRYATVPSSFLPVRLQPARMVVLAPGVNHAAAAATASCTCMSHLQVRIRKFTVHPIEKINLQAMHTLVWTTRFVTTAG